MHVVLVSTFYYPQLRGGTEHSIQLLAEELVRRGVEVTVLSFNPAQREARYAHNGVNCRALPVPNLSSCLDPKQPAAAIAKACWHVLDIYNPAAERLLERHLLELDPDIVQTHNLPGWSCAAWTAIRRAGAVHIQVLHDYQLTCPTATRFRRGKNCETTCAGCVPFGRLRRHFSQRVTHVVANSHYTRQLHRDLGFFASAGSIEVIYGAVRQPRASERHRLPAPDQPLRVGYIGRLHPTKGVDLLIQSFLSASRADLVLRIAGTGSESYEARLRQSTQGKAVEFVGHTPTDDFFPSIDVLVVPSLWNEPMGRVVIEAATHGVPVIAAARGGIPELVKEGRTGWLFDPARPDQLTTLIGRLSRESLQAKRTECADWGRTFSPEIISAQWLALYESLLGTDQPTPEAVRPKPLAGLLS